MDDVNELRVELVEGIISNTEADVIVNSTNRDLKLGIGALSKSVLQGAGQEIQTECSQMYPQGLAWGEIGVTGGYKLPCKKVYHGVLPAWNTEERGVNPRELLCKLVCACLNQAHADMATSIAFPTLGCGFLNFPHHEVAMTMCQCVAMFKSLHEISTLKIVYVVIYTKGQDWKHIRQAFCQELGLKSIKRQQSWGEMFSRMFSASRIGANRAGGAPVQENKVGANRAEGAPVQENRGDRLRRRTEGQKEMPSRPVRNPNALLDTCRREQSQNSCKKILPCGHICGGVKNEASCPPCLQKSCPGHGALTQSADDNCIICYTEVLSAAPVIKLSCGHLYHMHCVKRILDNKWVGARITFNFMNCPMCKKSIEHPLLDEKMAPLKAMQDDVRRKATMRLQYEGLADSEEIRSWSSPYFRKPEQFAMDRYCYYPCFKCKTAYFGGVAQCEQGAAEREFEPKDLICPACSNPDPQQVCNEHGTSFLEYKCRYCCSIAVFFCFGTTHFCNVCHDNYFTLTRTPVDQLPRCPAGPVGKQLAGKCPLNVNHPPTGTEFSLGCGICANTQSF